MLATLRGLSSPLSLSARVLRVPTPYHVAPLARRFLSKPPLVGLGKMRWRNGQPVMPPVQSVTVPEEEGSVPRTFEELGLRADLLQSLADMGIDKPTKIQEEAIKEAGRVALLSWSSCVMADTPSSFAPQKTAASGQHNRLALPRFAHWQRQDARLPASPVPAAQGRGGQGGHRHAAQPAPGAGAGAHTGADRADL